MVKILCGGIKFGLVFLESVNCSNAKRPKIKMTILTINDILLNVMAHVPLIFLCLLNWTFVAVLSTQD